MTPALTTPVATERLPFTLAVGDGIVTIGSCFADEMASRLADGGFSVEKNPFGTLYNPASVAVALDYLIDDRKITASDLVQHDGLWHSWYHHGSFSRPSADECLEVCNAGINMAHKALADAGLLMVTFGTAWVFELSGQRPGDAKIVSNCHKLPSDRFVRRLMTVDEIVAMWTALLDRLHAFNPQLSVLFTVSPIRHMADGAHGNQLSKSVLLLAIDRLSALNPQSSISYFPAYEIVLDELRDYRFFASDMTHPSELAADIVYDRLEQCCMSPATRQLAHNNRKAARRSRHIPLR